jgi:hypothetical protein
MAVRDDPCVANAGDGQGVGEGLECGVAALAKSHRVVILRRESPASLCSSLGLRRYSDNPR